MTKVCLVGYTPPPKAYTFSNQHVLTRAFEMRGCEVDYLDISIAQVNDNNEITQNGIKLAAFDIGVFATPMFTIPNVSKFARKNKVLDTLKTFTNTVFVNEIEPHINSSCKTVMYEYLKRGELPYPKTASLFQNLTDEELEALVLELNGYPIVMKNPLSSMGREVFLCHNLQEIRAIETTLRTTKLGGIPIVIQEYFSYSDGVSMNVRVIGEKVYPRITLSTPYQDSPFKGNFAKGRGYIACKPIPELEELCIKATKELSLDTARLDVFVGENGFSICEVNSLGSFIDSEMAWLKNIGEEFVDFCLDKIG